jgi:molybdopterin-containing oxidoreductase family iron-sulfur binding subunit
MPEAGPAFWPEQPTEPADALELVLRPDPHILDGRFATNAWLQELPKPMTKLTWENAAHFSPATAKRLGVAHGEIVDMEYGGRAVQLPAFVLPGHADNCVTVHNAWELSSPVGSLVIRPRGGQHVFSTTQEHQTMDVAQPVHFFPPIAETEPPARPEETLYPPWKYTSPAWGMAIDLDLCTGCSACTIACQVENNIPVVGREQVLKGREMHWIRVDRYFSGAPEEPEIVHQPVPCMQCENAPCELVCPVAATVHDHQGLNLMVYNRCIGTRYCSNNCPYKVRRFNFLQYVDNHTPQLKLGRNPEVSVRMRGVMEKCTYCIQRISAAQIAADKEDRAIREGEVVPACAQACPAEAIVFGDLATPGSAAAKARRDPRNYELLGDLNTRPRTTYLARRRRGANA